MHNQSVKAPSQFALRLILLWEGLGVWLVVGGLWLLSLPTLVLTGPVCALLWTLARWAVAGRSIDRTSFKAAWRSVPWRRSTMLWLSWLLPLLLGSYSVRWYALHLSPTIALGVGLAALIIWVGMGLLSWSFVDQPVALRHSWKHAYNACVLQPRLVGQLWLSIIIWGTASVLLPPALLLLPPWLAIWSSQPPRELPA